MKQIPINKWTIGATILIALMLIGLGGVSAKPETKTITETRTVEKRVNVPGKTKEILSDTCRQALVTAVQNTADWNQLVVTIGEAVANSDSYKMQNALSDQQDAIDGMLAGAKLAMQCDSSIGQEINLD